MTRLGLLLFPNVAVIYLCLWHQVDAQPKVRVDASTGRQLRPKHVRSLHPDSLANSASWGAAFVRHTRRHAATLNQTGALELKPVLNTSFVGFITVPVAVFNTSEATLTILDTAVRTPTNRTSVQRVLVNMDRPGVFVSEAALIVPAVIGDTLNTSELPVDHAFLDMYGAILVAPPFVTGSLVANANTTGQVLVIGLGGSQLNNFLHFAFPLLNITVVELQPMIGDIARKFFGFQDDETQQLLIMDGLDFMQIAINNSMQYDALYVDACPSVYPTDEPILCPGHAFLRPTTIANMRQCLTDTGTLVIKMLLITDNVTATAEELADPFRKLFGDCVILPMVNPNNRVLVCVGQGLRTVLDDRRSFWRKIMSFRPHEQNVGRGGTVTTTANRTTA